MEPLAVKDYGHGITGRVFYDPDASSPIEGDGDVKLCILHRHYVNPSPECGDTGNAIEAWGRANRGWQGFKVWLYDHSGTVYGVGDSNPFSCPWDSGRAGMLFLRKRSWPKKTREASARDLMQSYTTWANGCCLYYSVSDGEGVLDSCGGYYDQDECVAEMDDAAAFHVADAKEEAANEMAEAIQNERPDLTPA